MLKLFLSRTPSSEQTECIKEYQRNENSLFHVIQLQNFQRTEYLPTNREALSLLSMENDHWDTVLLNS